MNVKINNMPQELSRIRHDLLVWAGYHWGTDISEASLPRFHEIISHLSTLIPDTIIIQGGTCWACGELGSDMHWWHVAVDDGQGKIIGNERKSYLIHKTCVQVAEKKAQKKVEERK